MYAVQLSHSLGRCRAGVHRRFHRAYIAPYHHGHQTGADLYLADEPHVGRLYHGIRCLDGSDQSAGFDHS